ncbi:MAG: Ger(x)C family spore germination protein [Christensenellales bacterium]|jgi:spore germination protein KC
MSIRVKRITTFILLVLTLLLSGCWDNRELHKLFIVTGIALDAADNPEEIAIAVQIAKGKQESSGSGDSKETEDSGVIVLEATGETAMQGLAEFNRDSSRTLLLQHNQVLLLGSSMAEQGVKDRIDMFMREQQARMEVLILVVDGRAKEVLSAQMEQDRISGMFLSNMIADMAEVSPHYEVRMLDFASRILDETTSPVAPLIRVLPKDDKQQIVIDGMAVFKQDKMIGRMNNDETLGYIWGMGDVEQCGFTAGSSLGKAAFQTRKLDTKRTVTLRPDGGVQVALNVEATLNIGELRGFEGMKPEELTPHLTQVATEEIRRKITDTFVLAQEMNADIYGFGTSVYRKYPKEWKFMKARWDQIFPDIDLDVQIKVNIPATGQIIQSLEMEGST